MSPDDLTIRNLATIINEDPRSLDILRNVYKKDGTFLHKGFWDSAIQELTAKGTTKDNYDYVLNPVEHTFGKQGTDVADIFMEQLENNLRETHPSVYATAQIWHQIDTETKLMILESRSTDTIKSDTLNEERVLERINIRPNSYHLLRERGDRQKQRGLVQSVASTSPLATRNANLAIDETIANFYGKDLVGYDSNTGEYLGIPRNHLTSKYGVDGDQVVFGGQRNTIEKFEKHGYKGLTLHYEPGSNEIPAYISKQGYSKEIFLRECFRGGGSYRCVTTNSADTENWEIAIIQYTPELQDQRWWFLPTEWYPNKIKGYVRGPDGNKLTTSHEEGIKMALTDEIVSGIYQMRKAASNFATKTSSTGTWDTGWDQMLEWYKEYNNPSKIDTDPQQSNAWWSPVVDMEEFSHAQVDYVLKPLIEHFANQMGIRPSNEELQEYFDDELAKHGGMFTQLRQYLKKDWSFGFLTDQEIEDRKLKIDHTDLPDLPEGFYESDPVQWWNEFRNIRPDS